MSDVRLSICMPTYNFGKFIGETLDSILMQIVEGVEIVIVDGASTDNTQEVVEAYQKKSAQIKYHRLPVKGGIDADMHASVALASGEYCWLFSSDDVMLPGCLDKMLQHLSTPVQKLDGYRFEKSSSGVCPDIVVCGLDIYSLDLKELICKHPVSEIKEDTIFNFSVPEERLHFFQQAITTTAFFSFMSSLAFRRSRWMETEVEETFFGDCWAHAARMLRMIPKGLHVMYLPESYLNKRAFNDSFMDKGFVFRLGIAINGYHKIADRIFGRESKESFHLRRVLRNEISTKTLIYACSSVRSTEERELLKSLTHRNYCDVPMSQKLYKLLFFLVSPFCARVMIKSYHCFKMLIRNNRLVAKKGSG